MMTFFTILLILIGANAIFMVFSLSGASGGNKRPDPTETESTTSKIYPLHDAASKFKKAV